MRVEKSLDGLAEKPQELVSRRLTPSFLVGIGLSVSSCPSSTRSFVYVGVRAHDRFWRFTLTT